ncbi:MAG: hypothetical protein ABR865_07945 [Terracidiphilus sp.]|jgi:hypothetical protein
MKSTRFLCSFAVVAVLGAASIALAQTTPSTPAGPVPPAILHAKSVFISNAGSEPGLFPQHFTGDVQPPYLFTGDQDRPYAEFYAALEATGDYKLLNDPSEADLVLEVQLPGPHSPLSPQPDFRLVIYSAQGRYVLWTIAQSIEPAELQKNRDKNFDQALTGVLDKFLSIAGKGPVPTH